MGSSLVWLTSIRWDCSYLEAAAGIKGWTKTPAQQGAFLSTVCPPKRAAGKWGGGPALALLPLGWSLSRRPQLFALRDRLPGVQPDFLERKEVRERVCCLMGRIGILVWVQSQLLFGLLLWGRLPL